MREIKILMIFNRRLIEELYIMLKFILVHEVLGGDWTFDRKTLLGLEFRFQIQQIRDCRYFS